MTKLYTDIILVKPQLTLHREQRSGAKNFAVREESSSPNPQAEVAQCPDE
jgi:hypothetical protein